MSSLTDAEKRYFEKLFEMDDGKFPHYNDQRFDQLFKLHRIDISDQKYQMHGNTKAKRMRSFWAQDEDALVGEVLKEMLDAYEANCKMNNKDIDVPILREARTITSRLSGVLISSESAQADNVFLRKEFSVPNIQKLPIEAVAVPIIEGRLNEARITMEAGAHLSTIFLCGSVLEAVLLGAAQKEPKRFNQATSSPKEKDGSVKRFHEWSLSQLIDVSSEIGLLKPDIQKFGHGLRDFRNYIHPYAQMSSGFTPDEHTAKLCFQVLKAALASVAGERK